MKFKIGYKVRVRENLKIGTTYGEWAFCLGMEICKGKIVTIREVFESGYLIEEYSHIFTDEMLEEIKEEEKIVKFNVEDKVLVKGGNGDVRVVRKWILTREGTEFYLDNSSRPYKESELELYKEDKMEKIFQEVIADIKPGEVWESENNSCDIRVTRTKTGISIRDFNDNAIVWFDDNFRFKLKRKEYTFEEALAAYEEGKEIESCDFRYKKVGNKFYFYSKINNEWQIGNASFNIYEIRGTWYINE